ncbi:MAG: YigZ family protein [Clostridia bacterium]|nr:YigZ family protein [Clostridia bacterium]
MTEQYKTVRAAAQAEFIVKKSRFIGYISPVTTSAEALEFIAKISKRHWDATHNVYAYVIRNEGVKRYSDDGEPQGTAGIPTLDVLEKQGLTDCAVVVTRYFGGVMLGAGGLVRAYSHGAAIAVEAGGVVTRAVCARLTVTCDYTFYGRLAALVPASGGVVEETAFTDAVTLQLRIPRALEDGFRVALTEASNGRVTAVKIEELYADLD